MAHVFHSSLFLSPVLCDYTCLLLALFMFLALTSDPYVDDALVKPAATSSKFGTPNGSTSELDGMCAALAYN